MQPPLQLVTIMPMATVTLADPKRLPTTVGIVEKNPPFAIPFTILNIVSGARVVDTGQTASMLIAARLRARNRALRGPILSHSIPLKILPAADAKLKPANRPAPVAEFRPIALAKRGMKNGGTRRGNVPIAPAIKTKTKLGSLNRRLETCQHMNTQADFEHRTTYHSTNPPLRIAVRSFRSHAAGSPVAIVLRPRVRNAQAGPADRISGSSAKLSTAPPKPPPAKTTPLAKPRFLLKYCAGPVDVT